jgi:hypothetical protein
VSNKPLTVVFYDQILWFDVAVNDIFLVDVLKSLNKTSHKELGRLLVEASVSANVVTQVTTRKIVHYQVKVFTVLESVVHVHDECVVELFKNLPLVDHGLHTALGDDPCLRHLLHRIVVFFFFPLDPPYFAEPTLSNAEVVHEVGFRNSCKVTSKYELP